MSDRAWMRYGPRVLGYQPGWLWWAAALVIVVGAGALVTREVRDKQAAAAHIQHRITYHAKEQGLDVALVRAVVEVESSGNRLAKSNKNAKGLMQVTAIALEDVQRKHHVGEGDLYDVDYNLRVGTLYLKQMLDRFGDDKEGLPLALAAYNGGPTRIAKLRSKHPDMDTREMVQRYAPKETRGYVQKVLSRYEKYKQK